MIRNFIFAIGILAAQNTIAPNTTVATKSTAGVPAVVHSFTAVNNYYGQVGAGGGTSISVTITATGASNGILGIINSTTTPTGFVSSFACAPTCTVLSSTVASPPGSAIAAFIIPPANLTTGTTSVTITIASSGTFAQVLYGLTEYSGGKSAGTIDTGSMSALAAVCSSGGSATNCVGSMTTAYANDAIIAFVAGGNANLTTAVAGTNDTQLGQIFSSSPAGFAALIEQKTTITSTTGVTYNPGLTYTPGYAGSYVFGLTIGLELN